MASRVDLVPQGPKLEADRFCILPAGTLLLDRRLHLLGRRRERQCRGQLGSGSLEEFLVAAIPIDPRLLVPDRRAIGEGNVSPMRGEVQPDLSPVAYVERQHLSERRRRPAGWFLKERLRLVLRIPHSTEHLFLLQLNRRRRSLHRIAGLIREEEGSLDERQFLSRFHFDLQLVLLCSFTEHFLGEVQYAHRTDQRQGYDRTEIPELYLREFRHLCAGPGYDDGPVLDGLDPFVQHLDLVRNEIVVARQLQRFHLRHLTVCDVWCYGFDIESAHDHPIVVRHLDRAEERPLLFHSSTNDFRLQCPTSTFL